MSDQSPHKRPWSVVIAGGGTGGHLFPGIAVAREFQRRNPATAVLFIGSGKPLEERVLTAAGFPWATIAVAGLKGRGLGHQLATLARLPLAVAAARRLLAQARADLVLGVGGYSAGPVGIAAWLSGIPVVLHEQNLLPGITNRQLARFARRICVSFEASMVHFPAAKVRLTGNPVRPEILAAAAARGGRFHGAGGRRQPGSPPHQSGDPGDAPPGPAGSPGDDLDPPDRRGR
jgi:UDP-N-acetylglucosamine--N-acetylmuramyl-(pentapeptide) pyrophosphoryl-undecaprenol N-acetylglucosamine transferase